MIYGTLPGVSAARALYLPCGILTTLPTPTSRFFPYPHSDFLGNLHWQVIGPCVAQQWLGYICSSLTVSGDLILATFLWPVLASPRIYFGVLVLSHLLTGKAWPLQAGLVCRCWENLLLLPEPRGQGIS